ncbi:predicted protein [Uncinocarpus reesii 1704]|uniref:J domain-containing protein n=1 Tax=Uncinocarpus reesii (strain UAMH 1704) TaxID=336963 RepID=C4JM60_UNCRE|nr:uncharacterized protein UREG_03918 [Uncinocarpus reesii 1704]EEP79072.1 predicted protein [Uncinocarpus reesii 1704]
MPTRNENIGLDEGAGNVEEASGFGSYSEEEYDKITAYSDDVDYYSLLALPHHPPPTEAQIRSAYRTLTLSFHPDKQPPHLRDVATKHFDRIREAYDTLMDPKKRVVYDMLGEQGVKDQWGVGGILGRSGEAERYQIGVKTMDIEQFRRWFLRRMKLQELKAIEQLVHSKGSISINIDTHGLAMRMIEPSAAPDAPLSRISSLALGFNFKTPFAPLLWLRQLSSGREGNKPEDDEGVPLPNEQDAELEIHTGVRGKLQTLTYAVRVIDQATQQQETKEVTVPHVLMAKNISLGATLRHRIHIPAQKSPAMSVLLFPLLGDSLVEVGSSLLPAPTLHTTFTRRIQPVKGTRPLNVTVQGLLSDLSFKCGPTINASISRHIGTRGLTYCNWSSGKWSWPSFIQHLLFPLTSAESEQALTLDNPSKFEIGYVALPVKRAQNRPGTNDDDEELEDDFSGKGANGSTGEPLETWGFQLHSSPLSMQLSMNYARSFFGGKAEELPRSEWNYEGYRPQKETRISRAVRLEIETVVGVDLSLGWMVSGSRQVGNFTRMGLGVGVQGGEGLVCSLSWHRLGQSIKIPIAVCPLQHLDGDVGVLAVIIPWVTYSIVEFGFLRPRERRKQKQALAKERKRLRGLVAKRKAESDQAIELMREQVERRQARESDRNGLVILRALYGYVPSRAEHRNYTIVSEPERLVDVTIPVAALVDQGQLTIPRQVTKVDILSFT